MKQLILILFFILTVPLLAVKHIVCEDCQMNNLSVAINNSDSGDTIIVRKGIYTESQIIINKPLTIIGENYPRINANKGEQIFTIKSDSVSLIGLELSGVKRSFIDDKAAIYVDNVDYALIENNKIINTFFGVYLAKSKGSRVLGNKIIGGAKKEMNSANAIHLWYCQNLIINNNEVHGHRDGLYLEFCSNSIIKNNLSSKNLRYGLHFMFSNNNKYIKNTFKENGVGVAVMYSYGILMSGNKFINNWGPSSYGLLLKEIKDSKIQSNLFEGNTKGIYGESVIRVNIKHNNFKSNGWAMQMMGSSEQDTIRYNNFISNTFDISTNQNALNYCIYVNNYWSNYNGYDLDKDGIGDVPYRPVKFFSQVLGYTPEAIILLRSFFIELLNFIENVIPVLTPENLKDVQPMMNQINNG